MRYFRFLAVFFTMSAMISCNSKSGQIPHNPKMILGHHLFFERKLSFNHSKSCASCHSPELAFTDGYRRSVASNGENLSHNAPSLFNISGNNFFDWDNSFVNSLKKQIQRPLYSKHPLELGLDLDTLALFSFFERDSLYSSLFVNAFQDENRKYTTAHVEESIIEYVKNLVSQNSKYDKYSKGQKTILTKSEMDGMILFFSAKLKCSRCHTPPLFTKTNLSINTDTVYANIGMYNINNKNEYPSDDKGLAKRSKKNSDDGKFKIPSLRNVMLTAPYMHDGSMTTIQEVIDMYAAGGRNIKSGFQKGDGRTHLNKHPFISGFAISDVEKKELISFLSALTDTSYLKNSLFLNPFRSK